MSVAKKGLHHQGGNNGPVERLLGAQVASDSREEKRLNTRGNRVRRGVELAILRVEEQAKARAKIFLIGRGGKRAC